MVVAVVLQARGSVKMGKNERFFALEAGVLDELVVFFVSCDGQTMEVDCRRMWSMILSKAREKESI